MTDRHDQLESGNRAVERLSAAWNAFVRGDAEAVTWVGTDAAVVRAVHALDTVPDPNPAFLGRLKEDLMRAEPVVAATPLPCPASLPVYLSNGTAPARALPHVARSSRRTWRLPAAAVLAIVVGYSGLALWGGGDDPSEPKMLPAYGAASAAALPWQETPECDVPTRSVESFEALLAESMTALPIGPINPDGSTMVGEEDRGIRGFAPSDEVGIPADATTVAAIEVTVRELTACRNARQQGRHYALWTDAAILRADEEAERAGGHFSLLTTLIRAGEYIEQLEGTPEAVSVNVIWTFDAVEDVRVLSDGRVRAMVFYGVAGGELPMPTYFVEQDGVYLLDDAEGWTYTESG